MWLSNCQEDCSTIIIPLVSFLVLLHSGSGRLPNAQDFTIAFSSTITVPMFHFILRLVPLPTYLVILKLYHSEMNTLFGRTYLVLPFCLGGEHCTCSAFRWVVIKMPNLPDIKSTVDVQLMASLFIIRLTFVPHVRTCVLSLEGLVGLLTLPVLLSQVLVIQSFLSWFFDCGQ